MYAPDKSCIDFVKGFESFVAYPYDDLLPPINGAYREWIGGRVLGTLTIGYGHTDAAKHPLKVVAGLRVTEPQAADILAVDMGEVTDYINTHITVPFTQGQGNAMESFGFNCGLGSLGNIARRVNAGNYDEARAALDLYVYSKGQRLLGLQRRRDGEQALWDAFPTVVPTEIVHHTSEVEVPSVDITEKELAAGFIAVKAKIDEAVPHWARGYINDAMITTLVAAVVDAVDEVRDQKENANA